MLATPCVSHGLHDTSTCPESSIHALTWRSSETKCNMTVRAPSQRSLLQFLQGWREIIFCCKKLKASSPELVQSLRMSYDVIHIAHRGRSCLSTCTGVARIMAALPPADVPRRNLGRCHQSCSSKISRMVLRSCTMTAQPLSTTPSASQHASSLDLACPCTAFDEPLNAGINRGQ